MECFKQHLVTMMTLLMMLVLAPEGAGEPSMYTGKDTDKQKCAG